MNERFIKLHKDQKEREREAERQRQGETETERYREREDFRSFGKKERAKGETIRHIMTCLIE